MFWRRSRAVEAAAELRILGFLGGEMVFCQTARSLATKLAVDPRIARAVLERLVRKGTLRQHIGRLHRLHDHKRIAELYDYVGMFCKGGSGRCRQKVIVLLVLSKNVRTGSGDGRKVSLIPNHSSAIERRPSTLSNENRFVTNL